MQIFAVNSQYASGSIGVRPARSLFTEFNANIPAPCTATDPVFIFSHNVDPTLYNLFYVPDMGKRFFIVTSLVYREGNLYEYHCHVNLLLTMIQSWKQAKANELHTSVLLEHTNVPGYLTGYDISEQYDAKLYPVKDRAYKLDDRTWSNRGFNGSATDQPVFNVSAPHRTASMFTRHYSDNDRVYLVGYMDNSAGYRLAMMKYTAFNRMIDQLTQTSLTGVSDTALAKYYGNPTECIRMCKVLPCRWSDAVDLANAQSLSAVTSLTLGYFTVSGLSGCYIVPTQSPEMLLEFNQFNYYPRHPQNGDIPDKVINRAPHMEMFLSFPPFGTVELDSTGLGFYPVNTSNPYDMRLTETLDVCTGEATLYVTFYHGETAPVNYDWTATERPVMLAKANVCMDVPIIALVQNVGQIRSANLGLAQLDTKRNMPEAQLNRIITAGISSLWAGMEATPRYNLEEWQNNYANTGNTFWDTLKTMDAVGNIPILNALTNPTAKAPTLEYEKTDKFSQAMQSIGKKAGDIFSKTVSAMDTAYNFTLETAQYKTQLSDALHFPQVSITGNSSGSMSWMSTNWGRVDLYITYDNFVTSAFTAQDMGHECYKNVSNIIDLSYGTHIAPVNRVSLATQNVFIRNADCGQLTDAEKTELRTILQTGFCFYDNNDGW